MYAWLGDADSPLSMIPGGACVMGFDRVAYHLKVFVRAVFNAPDGAIHAGWMLEPDLEPPPPLVVISVLLGAKSTSSTLAPLRAPSDSFVSPEPVSPDVPAPAVGFTPPSSNKTAGDVLLVLTLGTAAGALYWWHKSHKRAR